MCKFFSLVSDGRGTVYYFDAGIRKKIISEELDYKTDSHTSIADYFGFKGAKEDTLNKYEYNPLTRAFEIDQINTTDDSETVKDFCLNLDFKTIVPELIIKTIIHPFRDVRPRKVTQKDIGLLKQWASIWNSVEASVWESVGASVRASVGANVVASVGDSVGDSVWNSVWANVGDSVWESVDASVWDSVWAYTSSFFSLQEWKYIKHRPGQNPFAPCITLWERGFVPSFDGKTWRLHAGKNAEIVYELNPVL